MPPERPCIQIDHYMRHKENYQWDDSFSMNLVGKSSVHETKTEAINDARLCDSPAREK